MNRRYSFQSTALATLILGAMPVAADDGEIDPLIAFVAGNYIIVGREPNDGGAYSGEAHIELKGDSLVLRRRLGGREIEAAGRKEVPSPPGEGQILNFRWSDPKPMLMSCMVAGDLDNYARLTCLWAREDAQPAEVGFEAMFPRK